MSVPGDFPQLTNPDHPWPAMTPLVVWPDEALAIWREIRDLVRDRLPDQASAPEHVPQPDPAPDVFEEIRAERARQDSRWGGPEHDDTHGPNDWCRLIRERNVYDLARGEEEKFRRRMVVIAALAVAGIETHDRMVGKSREAPEEEPGVGVVNTVCPECGENIQIDAGPLLGRLQRKTVRLCKQIEIDESALSERDAEIARLRAEVERLQNLCVTCSTCGTGPLASGVTYCDGCDTEREDEIANLRADLERVTRERDDFESQAEANVVAAYDSDGSAWKARAEKAEREAARMREALRGRGGIRELLMHVEPSKARLAVIRAIDAALAPPPEPDKPVEDDDLSGAEIRIDPETGAAEYA